MASNQDSLPLLEDTVECRLYPAAVATAMKEDDMKQELLVSALKYSEFLKTLTHHYIWYHEELRISLSREPIITELRFTKI